MATTFALWDLETGNLAGAYDTEDAALTIVRRSIKQWGRESVATLALARESQGKTTALAEGDALAERAQVALAAKPGAISA
ncbi:MAG: hypothetical protein M3442_10050 [Chloroflexota bacterium]|nr:hypothetical protein [Chloroflexota bacterium]